MSIKLVDATALDSGLDLIADAIRTKTGDSADIAWAADNTPGKGFADAIAAISGGGSNGLVISGKEWAYGTFNIPAGNATSDFAIVHGLDSPVWGFAFRDAPASDGGYSMKISYTNNNNGSLSISEGADGSCVSAASTSYATRRTYIYGSSGDANGENAKSILFKCSSSYQMESGTWYWIVVGGNL